jgi:hypothetical protein
MWSPDEDDPLEGGRVDAGSERPRLDLTDDRVSSGPDEQALNDFFDDNSVEEDRRVSGRLRRRR